MLLLHAGIFLPFLCQSASAARPAHHDVSFQGRIDANGKVIKVQEGAQYIGGSHSSKSEEKERCCLCSLRKMGHVDVQLSQEDVGRIIDNEEDGPLETTVDADLNSVRLGKKFTSTKLRGELQMMLKTRHSWAGVVREGRKWKVTGILPLFCLQPASKKEVGQHWSETCDDQCPVHCDWIEENGTEKCEVQAEYSASALGPCREDDQHPVDSVFFYRSKDTEYGMPEAADEAGAKKEIREAAQQQFETIGHFNELRNGGYVRNYVDNYNAEVRKGFEGALAADVLYKAENHFHQHGLHKVSYFLDWCHAVQPEFDNFE